MTGHVEPFIEFKVDIFHFIIDRLVSKPNRRFDLKDSLLQSLGTYDPKSYMFHDPGLFLTLQN